MISFTLQPSSGFVDSYLDIKFILRFDHSDLITVEIFNDTINKPIEILSISSGRIISETRIESKNTTSIEGYINLFNKDKMNEPLRKYDYVDVRCIVNRVIGNKVLQEEEKVAFYNQSHSLDSNIIPFDLSVINPDVDIKNNIPLNLYFVCDREKRYELCIMSEDQKRRCTFEVVTKAGGLNVSVPSEVIWHDLGLSNLRFNRKFSIYWVKFEGIIHNKFMNRKYIPIDNTHITFNDFVMTPQTTERIGPTGAFLPDHFILSHRYYVHTLRNWSEFDKMTKFGEQYLSKKTLFWHESQYMNLQASLFLEKDSTQSEIRSALYHQERNEAIITSKLSKNKKLVFETFSNIYIGKETSKIIPTQTKRKVGGCGCSRKRNA